MFLAGRRYEQIRNSVSYPHLNKKFGGMHVAYLLERMVQHINVLRIYH